MEKFGEFIKNIRKSKMTQREFAEQLGVGSPYISKLENGIEKTPSDQLLYKMAEILGVDEAVLFQKSGRLPRNLQRILLKDDRIIKDLFESIDEEENLNSDVEKKIEKNMVKNLLETDNIIFIIDPTTGQIIDASNAAIKFYGYSLEELRSKRIIDLNTLPEEVVKEKMKEAAVLRHNIFRFRHRTKSGDVKNVQVLSTPFSMSGKKYLFSTIIDI